VDLRSENYLEMPIFQNTAALTGYLRQEYTGSETILSDTPDTFEFPLDTPDVTKTRLGSAEIGYSQLVVDGLSLNLSISRQKLAAVSAWSDLDFASRYLNSDDDTGIRHGVKLSSDFHPNQWLSIVPSITYFDNSADLDRDNDVPTRRYSINTQLTPLSNHWTLSMLMQYAERETTSLDKEFDNKLASLDLAFKLGVSLSDNVQFSLIGKHDKRTASLDKDTYESFSQAAGSNLFLSFDISY
jgi:hypothetical protein